jgi:hypothetical protein
MSPELRKNKKHLYFTLSHSKSLENFFITRIVLATKYNTNYFESPRRVACQWILSSKIKGIWH